MTPLASPPPRARVAVAPEPWVRLALATLATCALLLAGCVAHQRVEGTPAIAAERTAQPATVEQPPGQATKLTAAVVQLPAPGTVPPVIGRLQRHRVRGGETLLTLARDTGVGVRELWDANPRVIEWEPKDGQQILVPSAWILPSRAHRGIVINIPEMRLYQFPTDAHPGSRVPVMTWPVGIGAEHAQSPIGPFTVKSKDMYPTWVVPDSIYAKMENPRRVVPPGPDNPLGDHRIRLSVDLYAIHGTNDPWTVGRLTTHGCIRLYPEDVAYLYAMVEPGMAGKLVYEPVKFGTRKGRVYVEVHRDVYARVPSMEQHAFAEAQRAGLLDRIDAARLRAAVKAQSGVPTNVTRETRRAAADAPPAVAGEEPELDPILLADGEPADATPLRALPPTPAAPRLAGDDETVAAR